jgi:hypothetical protein
MLAWKELLTCQFCFLEQAKEFHSRKVLLGVHLIHFELLEHCLYQQHLQHTCHFIHQLKQTQLYKQEEMPLVITRPQYDACMNKQPFIYDKKTVLVKTSIRFSVPNV